MRRGLLILLVASCVAAAVLSACTRPPAPAPPARTGDGPPPSALGVHGIGGGKVAAMGKAHHVDLEGGFWELRFPPQRVEGQEATHVVLVFPEASRALESQMSEGRDVRVVGRMAPADSVSIRMAGPELIVESVGVRID